MDAITGHARGRLRSLRGPIAIGIALFGAGVTTPLAWPQEPPPPPEGPAISQYVETLPSGAGGQAVGVGKSQTKPLPKHAAKKLTRKTTPLAPKLRSIATSSSYGAPQQTLPRHVSTPPKRTPPKRAQTPTRRAEPRIHHPKAPAAPVRPTEPERTALSAAVSAATGGTDRGPVILLGAIVLLTTAAGLVAAGRRARQAR